MVLVMIFVDQRAYQFALGLPVWLVDVFYEITDFGRSGLKMIISKAVTHPRVDRRRIRRRPLGA